MSELPKHFEHFANEVADAIIKESIKPLTEQIKALTTETEYLNKTIIEKNQFANGFALKCKELTAELEGLKDSNQILINQSINAENKAQAKVVALTAELEKANKRIDGSVQLTKLLERAEAELQKYRWIPVEERLPEELKETVSFRSALVLVTDGKTWDIARYLPRRRRWDTLSDHDLKPTHWMPTLTLPEQEAEKWQNYRGARE